MSGEERLAGLTDLLAETGHRHHEAFLATDGVDPEWPRWYAEHLEDEIERYLGSRPTRAELIQSLLDAAAAHERQAPERPWPEFYATFMLSLDEAELHDPAAGTAD